MGFWEIFLIAVGLSMDAFAVSVASGISIRDLKRFHAIRASLFFGFLQFIMPVIGWYLGSTFAVYIRAFDHWIAFGLLALIGGKMVWENLRGSHSLGDIRGLYTLIFLSIATSIDALAVGLSFSFLGHGIWHPAALIGGITFTVCLAGFVFGRLIGSFFQKRAGIAGGLVLIGIGVKILIEHLA